MEAGGFTSLSTVRDIVDDSLGVMVNAPAVAVVLPEEEEVRVPDELHVMLSDLDLEAVEMLMLPLLVGVMNVAVVGIEDEACDEVDRENDVDKASCDMVPSADGVGVRRVEDSVLPPTVFDRLADISLTVNVIDLVEPTELLADKDSAMDTLSE